MRWLLVVVALLLGACHRPPAKRENFAVERERMVREQIVSRGIHDTRVLAAMKKVPREAFVSPELSDLSYTDRPLPIGYDQTISQPYMVALMTEEIQLQPPDRVLEIGTGSGYQTAILAELVSEVYTIEVIEALAKSAEANLDRLGYENVYLKIGDGYHGWPERAPFDAIIATCAPERVPQPLIDQLKEGGRMIIPIGGNFAQELYLFEKINGALRERAIEPVRFVPMVR